MTEDATLDAFVDESTEAEQGSSASDDAAEAEPGSSTPAESTDADPSSTTPDESVDVEPATGIFEWSPHGRPCDECGSTTRRRWRDGERLVCPACKQWHDPNG